MDVCILMRVFAFVKIFLWCLPLMTIIRREAIHPPKQPIHPGLIKVKTTTQKVKNKVEDIRRGQKKEKYETETKAEDSPFLARFYCCCRLFNTLSHYKNLKQVIIFL